MKTWIMCLAALLGLASSARADVKFCFTMPATFVDNRIGEDNWLGDGLRAVRGADYVVRRNGSFIDSGTLHDGLGTGDEGAGCTPLLDTDGNNGTWQVELITTGYVNDNYIEGGLQAYDYSPASHTVIFAHSAGSGTHTVALPSPSDEIVKRTFNIFLAIGYSLYRHSGGLSGEDFLFFYDINGNFVPDVYDGDSFAPKLRFDQWSWERKFQIAYGVGKRLAHLAVGVDMYDRTPYSTSVSCPASNGSHSITSREYQAHAIQEGFAHFYAADVWNNHDEDDCMYQYFLDELDTGYPDGENPIINCEGSSPDFPATYMESQCGTPWEGRGVALDWLRTFWDLHTNTNIPFNNIISWLKNADTWADQTGYDELEEEAAQIGGTFYSTWHLAATGNGVDHPNE